MYFHSGILNVMYCHSGIWELLDTANSLCRFLYSVVWSLTCENYRLFLLRHFSSVTLIKCTCFLVCQCLFLIPQCPAVSLADQQLLQFVTAWWSGHSHFCCDFTADYTGCGCHSRYILLIFVVTYTDVNIIVFLHCFFLLTYCIYEGWNFNSGNYLFTTDTK